MSTHQQQDNETYSSDSESTVDIRHAMLADTESVVMPHTVAEDLKPDFWMATRQTQCGANHSERMVSFMKQITAAQSEFAEKLATISAAELSRIKHGSDDSAVYQDYWTQLQLAMRLCRTWSASTKEMTQAIGQLFTPLDRVVHVGRARLKESAIWNVELNKALSEFHTNVAKRQAKCYKALSVVMTPEYFDQSPARKSHAVRRAAPTVSKYVEQIDQANAWLSKYMQQRPVIKNRLETLEQKRIELTRSALTTFAVQIQEMGKTMSQAAEEIVLGVQNIDDIACKRAFISNCREMPTPHLENPSMFAYSLPVPLTELGIRGVREHQVRNVHIPADSDLSSRAPTAESTPRVSGRVDSADDAKIGKRFSLFANRVFGQQEVSRPRRSSMDDTLAPQVVIVEEMAELMSDISSPIESMAADREQITRFGNIRIQHAEEFGDANRHVMKTTRRGAIVANVDDLDRSTMTRSAPTA